VKVNRWVRALEILAVIPLHDSDIDILMSEEFEDEWYVICVHEQLGEVFEL